MDKNVEIINQYQENTMLAEERNMGAHYSRKGKQERGKRQSAGQQPSTNLREWMAVMEELKQNGHTPIPIQ